MNKITIFETKKENVKTAWERYIDELEKITFIEMSFYDESPCIDVNVNKSKLQRFRMFLTEELRDLEKFIADSL